MMTQLKHDPQKKHPGTVMLHWQQCEDEAEWLETRHSPAPDSVPAPGIMRAAASAFTADRTPQWIGRWAVVLLLLAILGGAAWHQAQAGLAKVESELQAAVEAESWLPLQQTGLDETNTSSGWQTQPGYEAKGLHGLAEPGESVTSLEIIDLGQDWATVRVTVQRINGTASYHQTRVYRQTAQGWTRVAPTASHWGQSRQLESRHLIFHYFSRDAAAVEDNVERFDELFAVLHTAFFQKSPSEEKLFVEIRPTVERTEEGQPAPLHNVLVVASPAAMLAPAELSTGDLLAQSLALAFFDHLAIQTSQRFELPEQWMPVRNALRLWFIWDQELPLHVWREPLVRWVFRDPEIATLPNNPLAPAFAHKLCAEYNLWVADPIDLSVPVVCLPALEDEGEIYAWRYAYLSPAALPLQQLMRGPTDIQDEGRTVQPFSEDSATTVALATVMEYASMSYGPGFATRLLAALPAHNTLETLVPAAFGVSLAEFDAGWHTFLTEQYGLSLRR